MISIVPAPIKFEFKVFLFNFKFIRWHKVRIHFTITLLQSLIEHQIDGIKYISTNIYVSNTSYTRLRFVNYAFPAKGNDKKLINYFLSSSVINAASCQGVDSLRNDVQEISKFLNGLQDSLRGGRSSSHARLTSSYGGDRMPYNSGSEGFVYRDSVFGEIERILINELRWLKK